MKAINSIYGINSKKKFSLPSKLKLAMPIQDINTGATATPTLELDLSNGPSNEAFIAFSDLIEEAEEYFSLVTRTDIPYYIFIDELEAYMSDATIFYRDLRLIRDLVFTVKKINSTLIQIDKKTKSKTKIICSLRTEIVNSISRFIVSKEINKVISGFEFPLAWSYNNTNSILHPIFKILIKRINIAYKNAKMESMQDNEAYKSWFPEKIDGMDPVHYVLNNGWNKPRDIVRLIMAIQNGLHNNSTSFSKAAFEESKKTYSKESLKEIKEEMLAIYSPEDIDTIMQCLNGFKTTFAKHELEQRISIHFKGTILDTKLNNILADLYRLGVIGNYSPASRSHRWQHRGDDEVIISMEWSFMIHHALQSALSVRKPHDRAVEHLYNGQDISQGDRFDVSVTKIKDGFVFVEFLAKDKVHKGAIHSSKLPRYVSPLEDFANIGDRFTAEIIEYDIAYGNWKMTLKFDE